VSSEVRIDEKTPRFSKVPWLVVAYLTALSMCGVLIRHGIGSSLGPNHLGLLSGDNALFPDLVSNVVGSLVMGIVGVSLKRHVTKLHEPLLLGITTGLCGSITTYSGWNHTMATLVYQGHVARAILALLVGISLPYCALMWGRWIGNIVIDWLRLDSDWEPSVASQWVLTLSNWLSCVVSAGGIAVMIAVLSTHQNSSIKWVWVAVCIGPIGTMLRWRLALWNKCTTKRRMFRFANGMPWGTLAANVIASILYEVLVLVQSRVHSELSGWLVNSFKLGLLGCLSTVSTFMSESYAMAVDPVAFDPSKSKYKFPVLYILVSFMLSIGLSCVVMAGQT
jgi:fluoride exporter